MQLSKSQRANNIAAGLVQHLTNSAKEVHRVLSKGAPEVKISAEEVRKALSTEQRTVIEQVLGAVLSPEERKSAETPGQPTPPRPNRSPR